MVSLRIRRYTLIGGLVVAALSVAIGLAANLLRWTDEHLAILTPLFMAPSLMLLLRHVQRVERGEMVEEPDMARLRGWTTAGLVVAVAAILVMLEVCALLAGKH